MANNKFFMLWNNAFQVNYDINPWMKGNESKVNVNRAYTQWQNLKQTLESIAGNEVVAGEMFGDEGENLPDIVFTANCGFIVPQTKTFIVSNFYHEQRKPESLHFAKFFTEFLDYELYSMPWTFEGAGDVLYDETKNIIWVGTGSRTNKNVIPVIREMAPKGTEVIEVKLVNSNYYHLDTCLCPLSKGCLGYNLAFDSKSVYNIQEVYGNDEMIWVSNDDAAKFACNAVEAGDDYVVMNLGISQELTEDIHKIGYKAYEIPLDEFLKSGGSAKCLTFKIY